jgi:hypothetical protein
MTWRHSGNRTIPMFKLYWFTTCYVGMPAPDPGARLNLDACPALELAFCISIVQLLLPTS